MMISGLNVLKIVYIHHAACIRRLTRRSYSVWMRRRRGLGGQSSNLGRRGSTEIRYAWFSINVIVIMHACMYVPVCSLLKVMSMKSFYSTSRKHTAYFTASMHVLLRIVVFWLHWAVLYMYIYHCALFLIRFTGSVKLKGILLVGGEEEQHPRQLKL